MMRVPVALWRRAPRTTSSVFLAPRSSSSSSHSAPAAATATSTKQPRAVRAKAHGLADLVDAARRFHEQHQHIVVPSDFVIPRTADASDSDSGSAAWPAHLHGLPLGRALRQFVNRRGRSTSKRRNKHLSDATSVDAVAIELQSLGLPLAAQSWRQFQWEQTALSALKAFKATHGHLRVPRTFAVPSGDASWPRPAWGYRLGAHVNQLRAHRATLEPYQLEALSSVGFIWNVIDDKWTSLFLPALRHFHSLYGHVRVPQHFVVPSGDPAWPLKALAGFPLGRMVNQIRSGDLYYPQVERFLPELNALGFSFSSIESTWDSKILPTLEVFHRVFGHCNVKKYFIVPDTPPWPKAAHGMKLGFIVHNIRARGDFFQLVGRDMEKLEQLGFVWNVSEARWRLRILPALKAFVHVHGHAAVPRGFVVPAAAPWPEHAAGLDLGRIAHDVSYRRRYADYIEIERSQLEALGFFWSAVDESDERHGVAHKPENAAIAAKLTALGVPVDAVHSGDWKQFLWEHVAVVALQTYRALHGHFFVPYAFRVPHGDAQWPRQTWGYKLGYWVVELRRDKSRLAPYQLQDLRAMRFVWDAREARWNQFFVPAMTKFAELYGPSARVPQAFVVPSDDARWPRALHGFRLGQKVNNLRCSGGYASAASADSADAGEWDDGVELVYNNWVLLDLLHDDRGNDSDQDHGQGNDSDTDKDSDSDTHSHSEMPQGDGDHMHGDGARASSDERTEQSTPT